MTTITRPTSFIPRTCRLTLVPNQRVNAAPFGGSEQAIDLLNDRWLLNCEMPEGSFADGAMRDAFIDSMRGQVNTVALYHFAQPAPRGTVRGSMTLASSAAQGASSIVISGCSPSNGTILMGDMFGVGGLLLRAVADSSAVAGIATVQIANRLRVAQSAGAPVTWDKPTTLFRLLSHTGVDFGHGRVSATSFDFGEAI